MGDFQKKNKASRLHNVFIAAAALVVLVICIMLVVANINIYHKRQQLNARIESLKSQVENLQKENDNLQNGITNADSSAYVEKVAREQLDFQKPGETVVSFVRTEPPSQTQKPDNKNILASWLGWISASLFK